jgi:hypothetical protein
MLSVGMSMPEEIRTEMLISKADLSATTLKQIQSSLTTVLQARQAVTPDATLTYKDTYQQIQALGGSNTAKVHRTTFGYDEPNWNSYGFDSGHQQQRHSRGRQQQRSRGRDNDGWGQYDEYDAIPVRYNSKGKGNKRGKSRSRSPRSGKYDDFPPGKNDGWHDRGRSRSKGKKGKRGKSRSPSHGRSRSPTSRSCKFGIECFDRYCWRDHPAGYVKPEGHSPRSYKGRPPNSNSRSRSPSFGRRGKGKH